MNLLIVLAFSILVTSRLEAVLATTYPQKHLQNKSRIFNGQEADPGRFPYALRLRIKNTAGRVRACGGALIGYRWGLTSAHCVSDAETLTVFLGSTCSNDAVATFEVNKTSILIHYKWYENKETNDIALFKIPKIIIDNRIRPVRLPRRGAPYPNYVDNLAIVSGWGRIGEYGSLADCLQWASMLVMDNVDCHPYYDGKVYPETICAIGSSEGSHCPGDSGGPLVTEFTRELIGLVDSTTDSGCEGGEPVIYVRITAYVDWIQRHTGISY